MVSSVPPPDFPGTMVRIRLFLEALRQAGDDLAALGDGADAVKRRRRVLDDLAAELGRQPETT
jgi:hypothetical protein